MFELEAQLRAYGVVLDRVDATLADVGDVAPRRMRRSYVVAVAAAVVVAIVASALVVSRSHSAPPPHIVTPGPTVPTPTSAPVPAATGVLAVGTQVMLGAKSALQAAVPGIVVDAGIARQVDTGGLRMSADLVNAASIGTVVVDLATNGLTSADQLDEIMRRAGARQVFFMTTRVPRVWEAPNNALIQAMPDRWKNAHVIDWKQYSTGHDDWFVADGFHLTTAGQQAYSLFIESSIGRLPPPLPPQPSGLRVVDVLTKRSLPPQPLAVAGGEVWVASESLTDAPFVRLEGHDATTAKLIDTIDVRQEAVFGIAGDGDTLWVAGGGDGGVPETTVSKVDTRTNSVVFTKTLTGTPCSCPIVAGSAGVWLVGNGSTEAFHLSSVDGHVTARVRLSNHASTSAMEIRARLLVGTDAGSVAVIDPATDRIERTVDLPPQADVPLGLVIAMSPATIPATGSDVAVDGVIARSSASAFALKADSWETTALPVGNFQPTTVVTIGSGVFILGGDRVELVSAHAGGGYGAVYDPDRRAFFGVAGGSGSGSLGFRDAVAADNALWVVYDDGNTQPSIVVVKTPENFPFK